MAHKFYQAINHIVTIKKLNRLDSHLISGMLPFNSNISAVLMRLAINRKGVV